MDLAVYAESSASSQLMPND